MIAESSSPAPWCGPCRMVAPELVKVAERNAGRLFVVKMNTDELDELGQRHGIRSDTKVSSHQSGLCQTARPTKNGPSRSR